MARLKTVGEIQRAKQPSSLVALNVRRLIQVRQKGSEILALRRTSGWVRVAEVRDRGRVDDRWWEEQSVQRMYLELLLDDHRRVTVFLDLLAHRWYEQQRTPEHRERWVPGTDETAQI